MQFNREYWKNNLKRELGLQNVPDEELKLHKVSFGFFNTSDDDAIDAESYIESQLKNIEESYNNVDDATWATSVLESFDSIEGESDFRVVPTGEFIDIPELNVAPKLLVPAVKPMKDNAIRYYDVVVNGLNYTVAVHFDPGDIRSHDMINHIKATSFFIEERYPEFLSGLENIISYYQFVNLIESHLKKSAKSDTAFEKIIENVQTTFDNILDVDVDVLDIFDK